MVLLINRNNSRKFTLLPVDTVNCVATLKAEQSMVLLINRNNSRKFTLLPVGTVNCVATLKAEQSMVLLINRNNTLPLHVPDLKGQRVALVGALANSTKALHGAYANPGTTDFLSFASAPLITPLTALERELSKHGASMTFNIGATPSTAADAAEVQAAVDAAKQAAVVVVVAGDLDHETCGETTDRSSLDLAGGQLALIRAVVATGTPTIVLLLNGRPTTFGKGNAALDGVAALMVGWALGEEGGTAFVNVLSGAVSPSGRLTQNWPRSVGGVGGPGARCYSLSSSRLPLETNGVEIRGVAWGAVVGFGGHLCGSVLLWDSQWCLC
jgi:beta-glucosidase